MDIQQQRRELQHQRDLLRAHVRRCDKVKCDLCQSWCDRNDCPICLSPLGDIRETTRCEGYPDDGCGCLFHADCSDEWLRCHVRCPSCRRVVRSDAESESDAMSETGDNDDDEDSDDGEAGEAREALVRSDVPLSGEGESIPEPTTAAQLPPGAPEQSAAAIAATAAMDKIDADESSGDDETSGDESSGDESSSDEEGRDDQAEEAAEAAAKARVQQGIWSWQVDGAQAQQDAEPAASLATSLAAAPAAESEDDSSAEAFASSVFAEETTDSPAGEPTYRSLAAPPGSPVRSATPRSAPPTAPHPSSIRTAASTPEKERDVAARASPQAVGKRPAEGAAAGGRLPFVQCKAMRSMHKDRLGHLDDVCAKEGPSGIANLCSGRLARNM